MKAVQGQQSFIKGQITPAAIARLGNDYFSACRSVKDLIIQKDGSAVCRGGFEELRNQIIDKGKVNDIEDISALKYILGKDKEGKDIEKFLFFYLSEGNVYFKFGNGEVESLNFSVDSIYSYKIDGSDIERRLNLDYDSKIKQSFTAFNTSKAIKIKKILDRVFVFYENCFPFKIWIQGDSILTAPFFQGGEDEIYNAFPFSRTVGDRVNLQKTVSNEVSGPLPDNLRLKLKIEDVAWDKVNNVPTGPNGECDASLTYDDVFGDDQILKPEFLSLEAFKGYPICFSIGRRKRRLSEVKSTENWPLDMKYTFDFLSGRPLVYSQSVLPPPTSQTNDMATVQIPNNKILTSSGLVDYDGNGSFSDCKVLGKVLGRFLVLSGRERLYHVRAYERRLLRGERIPKAHSREGYYLSNPDLTYARQISSSDTFLEISRDNLGGETSENNLYLVSYSRRENAFKVYGYRRINIRTEFPNDTNKDLKVYLSGSTVYFWNPSALNNIQIKRFGILGENPHGGINLRVSSTSVFKTIVERIDDFFIGGNFYYIFSNNTITQYLIMGETPNPKRFRFSENSINGYIHSSMKFIYSSFLGVYDRRGSYKESQALNALTEFTGDPEARPSPILTGGESERQLADLTRQYFSALGYRFFILFPYAVKEVNGKRKMRCRFLSLGFNYSAISTSRGLGGEELIGGEDETDNFVISDWFGGWPINGDSISGKDFFVTADSKLSYSSIRRRGLFGSPIKVLLNSSGFNYVLNRSKLSTILEEDFLRISPPLRKFFDRIDDEEDTVLFTLGDPFTYVFRDTDGDKVKILNFIKSDIGAFTAAGAQSIALTNKGVFYWGINAQATNTNSFVVLGKVSNFKGSDKFRAMVEVLNRVYVTDEFGDLYVVEYNETNRNFVAKPCSEDVDLKNMSSGISFPGNRILGVRDNGDNKNLYLANSEVKGILNGLSEFTVKGIKIVLTAKFDEEIFVLGEDDTHFRLLKYDKDRNYDINENQWFDGILETVPITVGKSHPFHSFLNQLFDIEKIAVWTDGKTVFGFKFDSNKDFVLTEIVNREGQSIGPLNSDPLVFLNVMGKISKGRGIILKLNSKERGCLCGLSVYGDIKQIP